MFSLVAQKISFFLFPVCDWPKMTLEFSHTLFGLYPSADPGSSVQLSPFGPPFSALRCLVFCQHLVGPHNFCSPPDDLLFYFSDLFENRAQVGSFFPLLMHPGTWGSSWIFFVSNPHSW